MIRIVATFLVGIVFGLGIAISGMADPAKVLNFFDIAGSWDPSLLVVMFSALATTAIGYRLVFRRGQPFLDASFHLPSAGRIDAPLVLGSAVFGVGWGIAGFCPGGAIPALGLGRMEPVIFVLAMGVGIFVARTFRNQRDRAAFAA